MRKKLSIILGTLFLFGIGLLLVLIMLYAYSPVLDKTLINTINRLAGEDVSVNIETISGNLIGTVRLDGVTVTTPDHQITCDRVELDYSLLDIIGRRFIVDQAVLIKPDISLDFSATDSLADSSEVPLDSLLAGLNPETWPMVRIGNFIVDDGTAAIKRATSLDTLSNLNMELSGEISDEKIALQPQYIRGTWVNRDIDIRNLTFKLLGNKKRVTLNQVTAEIPDVYFNGKGEVEFQPGFRVLFFPDSTRFDLNILKKFLPDLPFQEGYLSVAGHFINTPGKLADFQGEITVSGQLDSIFIQNLSAEYHKKAGGDALYLDNLSARTNVGNIDGQLLISQEDSSECHIHTENVNLRELGIVSEDIILNGRVDYRFLDWDLNKMSGEGVVNLNDFRAGDVAIDAIRLNVMTNAGNWHILDPSQVIVGEEAMLTVAGSIYNNQTIDIRLFSENSNVDTLLSHFAISDIGGNNALIDLHLTGKLDDPSIEGEIDVPQLTYGDNVELYGIYGVGNIKDVLNLNNTRNGDFNLEVGTCYLGDVFLKAANVNLLFSRNRIVANPFLFYSEEDSINGRAYISLQDTATIVSIANLELFLENYFVRNDKMIEARLARDTLFVDRFNMVSADSGRLSSRGYIALNGNSSLYTEIDNISVAPINKRLYWDYDLQGLLDETTIDIFGDISQPDMDVQVFLKDFSVDGYPVGEIFSNFSIFDGNLGINTFNLDSGSDSYLSLNGDIGFQLFSEDSSKAAFADTPLGLNIVLGNFRLKDYDFLYESKYPVDGQLTGRLDLSGTIRDPQGELTLSGENVAIGENNFPEIQLESRLLSDKIILDKGLVNFENSEIHLSGEKTIGYDPVNFDSAFVETLFRDKQFQLSLNIREDSLNFLNALNAELESLTGEIVLTAELEGDYDDPRITAGNIQVKDGILNLARYENTIEEIELVTRLQGSRLLIEKCTGRSSKTIRRRNLFQRWFDNVSGLFVKQQVTGDIAVEGYIDLASVIRPRYQLSVDLHNSYFNYFVENTEVALSTTDLQISGQDTIQIRGDVQVNRGDVELDFVDSEKNLLLITNVRETVPYLRYNINVEILPNFTVQNRDLLNSFNMQLSGNLKILQEPKGALEIYGVLETDGKYYIQGIDFEIQRGKIDFVNPKEIPELNLVALKERNDHIFNLNVRGKIDAPEKEIVVQDKDGNRTHHTDVKDQMALLLFGTTFDQLSGADVVSTGGEAVTQILISQIEREALTFTGLDRISLNSPDSFFQNRLNQPSTLSLGKYLTANLYLEYKSRLSSSGLGGIPAPSLSWEAGNQIYLQYRLNRNWFFSTYYENTQEGNGKVKLDISWQLGF